MGSAVKTHYEELAAFTLQLNHLEQRWKMNNQMVKSLQEERMNLVSQLYAFGLYVNAEGKVVKNGE